LATVRAKSSEDWHKNTGRVEWSKEIEEMVMKAPRNIL
jgi:hypothetical protein